MPGFAVGTEVYAPLVDVTGVTNWDVAAVQPFATMCFHIAYGAGTLFGLRYLFRQPPVRPIRPGLPIQQ